MSPFVPHLLRHTGLVPRFSPVPREEQGSVETRVSKQIVHK